MDIMQTIYERRSIREYTDRAIDREVLEKIVDAARWAPNGGNRNLWRFIVVTSAARKKLMLKFAPGIFDMPAALILVCMQPYQKVVTDNARMIHMADAACAATNIALAAHSEGIGSCLAVSFADIAIRKILSIPEGVNPKILVTLGYPDESPDPPSRKEITEITFDDDYEKAWS